MSYFRDLKVYKLFPELRATIRQTYIAKLAGLLTLLLFSPLIAIGVISIGLVHLFDLVGQYSLWPAHKITNWLHDYQRDQIRSAHSVVPIDKIQERLGDQDDD